MTVKVVLPTRKGAMGGGWHARVGDVLIEGSAVYDHLDAAEHHGGLILSGGRAYASWAVGVLLGRESMVAEVYLGVGSILFSRGWTEPEFEEMFDPARATPNTNIEGQEANPC